MLLKRLRVYSKRGDDMMVDTYWVSFKVVFFNELRLSNCLYMFFLITNS